MQDIYKIFISAPNLHWNVHTSTKINRIENSSVDFFLLPSKAFLIISGELK